MNKKKPSLEHPVWVGTVKYDCNKTKGLLMFLSVREKLLFTYEMVPNSKRNRIS